MDLKAICDAMAARYQAGTLATPTGAQAVRKAYGQAPQGLEVFPVVVVMPQHGTIVGGSMEWTATNNIDVNFYLGKSPGDIARIEAQRQLWLPTLLDAIVLGAWHLGLPGSVKSAIPSGWSFAELPYMGETFDAIVIHYEVILIEQKAFSG